VVVVLQNEHCFSGLESREGVGIVTSALRRLKYEELDASVQEAGHVNDPFPYETWGWHDYVKQQRVVNKARAAMFSAVGDRLSLVEAAS
jgi:hypothetical protein